MSLHTRAVPLRTLFVVFGPLAKRENFTVEILFTGHNTLRTISAVKKCGAPGM